MTDLERAREFFKEDKFAAEAAGIVITEVGEKYAKVELELAPIHYNAAGAVMGGVMFTMADYAFAVASNFGQSPCVTLSSEIRFLSGVRGKRLAAEAHLVKDGASHCFYEVMIRDDLGTEVASVSMCGYRVRK